MRPGTFCALSSASSASTRALISGSIAVPNSIVTAASPQARKRGGGNASLMRAAELAKCGEAPAEIGKDHGHERRGEQRIKRIDGRPQQNDQHEDAVIDGRNHPAD